MLYKLLVISIIYLFTTACTTGADNGAVDSFLGIDKDEVIVEVETPVSLALSITSPVANSDVGYLVSVEGNCNIAGTVIEFSGPSTGFSVCNVDQKWTAEIDLSSQPIGSINIDFKLKQGDIESQTESITYNKPSDACDDEAKRTGTFANASSPYEICTPLQLTNMATRIAGGIVTDSFILRNSLDFKGGNWNPVNARFEGTFDGNDFSISNLIMNYASSDDIGLFKRNGGTFQNLTLKNFSVSGRNRVSLFGGYNNGVGLTTTFNNITVINSSIYANDSVGGLIGRANNSNSFSASNINMEINITGNNRIGGLVGEFQPTFTSAIINQASISGNITGNQYIGGAVGLADHVASTSSNITYSGNLLASSNYAGGLYGRIDGGDVSNSSATGNITSNYSGGNEAYVGGIIGSSQGTTNINTCFHNGNISASSARVGGLIGQYYGSGNIFDSYAINGSITSNADIRAANYTGGLIGTAWETPDIRRSYSTKSINLTGTVNSSYVGGFIGYLRGGNVEDSYATGSVTVTNGDGITASGSSYGGFAGYITNNTADPTVTISGSYATGDITVLNAGNAIYAGGFVGYIITANGGTQSVTITDSYATGNIVSTNQYNGGFAGRVYRERNGDSVTLNNISASGDVTVSQFGNAPNEQRIGGLIGSSDQQGGTPTPGDFTLTNASASGKITITGFGGEDVGGIIGNLYLARDSIGTLSNLTYTGGSIESPRGLVGGLVGDTSVATNAVLNFTNSSVTIPSVSSTGTVGYVGGAFGRITVSTNTSLNLDNVIPNVNTVTSAGGRVGGLVGYVTGNSVGTILIQNINTIADVTSTSATGYIGGLIGEMRDYVQVASCSATGNISSAGPYTGGLAGGSDRVGRSISNSFATGNVTSTFNTYVGGLIGYMRGPITNSYALGDVSAASHYVGGLTGRSLGSTTENVFATGNVYGTNQSVGGLIGYATSSPISNAFATGNVTGERNVGGLVGYFRGAAGELNNTYSLGSVTRVVGTNNQFGEICGNCDSDGDITNSFYNSETSIVDATVASPEAQGNAGRDKTSAQLQDPGQYPGSFDFIGTLNSSWRSAVGFMLPAESTVYAYPVPYWLEN